MKFDVEAYIEHESQHHDRMSDITAMMMYSKLVCEHGVRDYDSDEFFAKVEDVLGVTIVGTGQSDPSDDPDLTPEERLALNDSRR